MKNIKQICKVGKSSTSLVVRLTKIFNLMGIAQGDLLIVSTMEIDGKKVIVLEK